MNSFKDFAQSINIEQDNLFNNWPIFLMYECIACMSVCVPRACLVPSEARRGIRYPELQLHMVERPCGHRGLNLVLCWTTSPAISKFYTSCMNVRTCELPLEGSHQITWNMSYRLVLSHRMGSGTWMSVFYKQQVVCSPFSSPRQGLCKSTLMSRLRHWKGVFSLRQCLVM